MVSIGRCFRSAATSPRRIVPFVLDWLSGCPRPRVTEQDREARQFCQLDRLVLRGHKAQGGGNN